MPAQLRDLFEIESGRPVAGMQFHGALEAGFGRVEAPLPKLLQPFSEGFAPGPGRFSLVFEPNQFVDFHRFLKAFQPELARARMAPAFAITDLEGKRISLDDLNQLRIWIESRPIVPEGPWCRDFGSFKLCCEGKYPKTFLRAGQAATGEKL